MRTLGSLLRLPVRQAWLVFGFAAAFVFGVGLASSGILADVSWSVLFGVMALLALRKKTVWALALVVLFGLSLGWWRGSVYQQKLTELQTYYGKQVTLVAKASQDANYGKHQQLQFDVKNPQVFGGQKLTGTIGVSGFGAADIYVGDTIKINGKLFPGQGEHKAWMSYAQLHVLKRGGSLVDKIRRRFNAGMHTALPEPLASFGMGLLIGQKVGLPDVVYQSLLMVGLVHIIAVSGYNLTVILRASNKMFKNRSRRLATLLALALIGIFLLFAGGSASIVRAAIVSVLAIGAAYYGRKVKPLVLIMLAGAITAWLNPYYVWGNVSWYLSFLAFFGVLVISPMVMARLPERLNKSILANVAVESLCAELMTIPYVLFIFGQISFIGLIGNVMVVMLVPLAMLLCLVAGSAGMLVAPIAGWFAWPAVMILNYMLDSARLLSHIPNIFAQNIKFGFAAMMVLYAAMLLATLVLWRKVGSTEFDFLLTSTKDNNNLNN